MTKTRSSNSASPNFRRNFAWNLIGTTVSASLSLFLMIFATRINGVDQAGIFSFAFAMATILQVIGTFSGRTFQVTDKDSTVSDSDYFYLKSFTSLAMFIVTVAICLIGGYSLEKSAILLLLVLFRFTEVLSECIFAIFQKADHLFYAGRSMCLKATTSILGFLIVDLITHNLIWACAMPSILHFVVILVYDLPRLGKLSFHLQNLQIAKIWHLVKTGLFTFGFTFLSLYLINSPKYTINSVASDDVQAIYGIIAMPATMLVLFGQYFIQPFLTTLKELFATDFSRFKKLTLRLCLIVLGFGALCLILAWALGIPVLELIYGIDLSTQLIPLLIIVFGGTIYALVAVLSASLITMRHTGDQFIAYLLASIFALLISPALIEAAGVLGACLTYALSMIVLFIIYLVFFIYRSIKHSEKSYA